MKLRSSACRTCSFPSEPSLLLMCTYFNSLEESVQRIKYLSE